ncbi:GYD domain-containing protein [Bacteroidota bacterium]
MRTYAVLWNFTAQGIQNVKDSANRLRAFQEEAEKKNVKIREFLWTMGEYDGMIVLEAPDDTTVASLMLATGALGNIRSKSFRGFVKEEIKELLEAIG